MKTTVWCAWVTVAFMFGMALGTACSIPDPSDEARIEAALPTPLSQDLIKLVQNLTAGEWLAKRPRGDQALKAKCRVNDGGWYDVVSEVVTVQQMFLCILANGEKTYLECAEELGNKMAEHAALSTHVDLDPTTMEPTTKVECKWVFDLRYAPEKLPVKAVDSSQVRRGDLAEFMMKGTAPFGFLLPAELSPLLCPLAASGWGGCPPKPDDVGAGSGAAASGDFH